MYEEFFGLQQRPFSNVPSAEDFAGTAALQDALDSLVHCITQARGIAVISSGAGMGKTMLCKRLAKLLQQNCRTVILSAAGMETRLSLLQAILFELNMGYVGLTDQEARLKLFQAARDIKADRRSLLLTIDEAHLLTPRLFEELRTLAEYAPEGESLIQVVLCGSFELEELLADPGMLSFNQRIGLQISLNPLTFEDSAKLLSERFKACGEPDIFTVMTEEALEMICRASDGNLRCLTQLADHACLLAFANDQRPFGAQIVRSALENLKELPLRWNEIPGEAAAQAEEDESWTDHLSEINFGGEDVIAIPRPKVISPTEQETDEFTIPAFLRLDDDSIAPTHSALEVPLDEGTTTTPPLHVTSFEDETEFAVYEVGAGVVQNIAESSNPDRSSFAAPAIEEPVQIFEFPPAERRILPAFSTSLPAGMSEQPVLDRYALLDRLFELPEERRHTVDLTGLQPEPEDSSFLPAATLPGTPISIPEEEILELVQQIRRSVQPYLGSTGHVEHSIPEPHHSIPMVASTTSLNTQEIEPATAMHPGEESEPQQRRFADLFTRLRQRRRKIEAEQA